MKKVKVAFVCVGNSCRSQMAEGFARELAGDRLDVYSAGTDPADSVRQHAVKVMQEKGIDINEQYPKFLEDIPNQLDVLITMGCGVSCPYIPCKFREDWGLEDPAGKPIGVFRETRDIIEKRVKGLIERIDSGELGVDK